MRIMKVQGRRRIRDNSREGVMYAVDGGAYFTDLEMAAEVAFEELAETMRVKPSRSLWSEFSMGVPVRRDAWCSTCGAVHRTDLTCPLLLEIAQEQAFRNGHALVA